MSSRRRSLSTARALNPALLRSASPLQAHQIHCVRALNASALSYAHREVQGHQSPPVSQHEATHGRFKSRRVSLGGWGLGGSLGGKGPLRLSSSSSESGGARGCAGVQVRACTRAHACVRGAPTGVRMLPGQGKCCVEHPRMRACCRGGRAPWLRGAGAGGAGRGRLEAGLGGSQHLPGRGGGSMQRWWAVRGAGRAGGADSMGAQRPALWPPPLPHLGEPAAAGRAAGARGAGNEPAANEHTSGTDSGPKGQHRHCLCSFVPACANANTKERNTTVALRSQPAMTGARACAPAPPAPAWPWPSRTRVPPLPPLLQGRARPPRTLLPWRSSTGGGTSSTVRRRAAEHAQAACCRALPPAAPDG